MDHEPCKSRGDCYHARGARNQPREAKARGGRNQPREVKARGGHNQPREAKARGACNQPREAKVRCARNIPREAKVRGGRNGGRNGGRIAVEKGTDFATLGCKGGHIAAEILRQKPNRKEQTIAALLMTFYPNVWTDIIWQRRLPNGLHGVPDLQHPIRVIGEYDGGGHNAFEDRRADDAAKDAERRAAGYAVVRETDPYVLVMKFAFAVKEAV